MQVKCKLNANGLQIRFACISRKSLGSTYHLREPKEIVSLFYGGLNMVTCYVTHWLLVRIQGLYILLSYLALLYAESYGNVTHFYALMYIVTRT